MNIMNLARIARRRFEIAIELLAYCWSNKRGWMFPMVIVLLVFAVMLIVAESSAIAPFIYSLY